MLPGAPRGSFITLAKFHPSAVQALARCLTPWLRWLALLRINPHEPPGPEVHVRGGGVVSQVISGSVMLVNHADVTRVNHMKKLPLNTLE
jgi:hypothetical protein